MRPVGSAPESILNPTHPDTSPERRRHRRYLWPPLRPNAIPSAPTERRARRSRAAPLTSDELRRMDAYWRASLYLCLGMIYLRDNPLLREPLALEHLKVRLRGHWGSDPGQSLVYVHLNRLIKKLDLDVIFLSGPGHGAPALLSNAYLEGTYSEVYPTRARTSTACGGSSSSSPSPAASAAIALPRPPARSTRGASWATPSRTPTGRPSTHPTGSSWSWSATASRKPARWRRPGTPTSSSTPSATAPCCRSST